MKRMFDCGVLLRMYTMAISTLYAFTGITQEETLVYNVAHSDRFSLFAMTALGIFAVLGIIDLVVNDLMPDKFTLLRALHDRHLVNMGITGCFAVQIWSCVKYDLPYAVLPFYAVYILMIPASTLVDVRKRYIINIEKRRKDDSVLTPRY